MIIDKNFKMRVEDINEIFTMLSFVLKLESHKNKPLLRGCKLNCVKACS